MIERIQQLANGAGISATAPGRLSVQLSTGPLPVDVRPTQSGAELVAVWPAPPAMAALELAPLARITALARTGLLRCEARPGSVVIVAALFSDGLTQQAVLTAATEVGKTYEILNVAAAEWDEQRKAAAEAARTIADIDAALAAPSTQPAQPARPQQPAQPAQQAQPAQPARPPQPVPAPAAANGWRRSHLGPPDGLQAWAAPDPNAQSTRLPGNLDLRVVEVRGGWAHVDAQNGWHGWVDARALRPMA